MFTSSGFGLVTLVLGLRNLVLLPSLEINWHAMKQ